MTSSNDTYTIGWISALPTELTAAKFFLDTTPSLPEAVDIHDTNSYVLGKMGRHNVVIACLPDGEYGTTAASVVATNMLRSFPNIRFGLMVGIGGGAPSEKNNMHLGDIAVSGPGNGYGGVLQYDFGKSIQDRTFTMTGYLNQPPQALRTAVAILKSEHEAYGHRYEAQIGEHLDESRLTKAARAKYSRPDATSDRLYRPLYVHGKDEASCGKCGDDPNHLVPRPKREDPEDGQDFAVIHYGLIASANQLMKDATVRDGLARDKGVLCFEMEAAGLMNNFPCLVIRGICDYSDSHKNKGWQGFAAMMAAAYAKELLLQIAPGQVEGEKTANEVLGIVTRIEKGVDLLQQHAQDTNDTLASLKSQSSIAKLKEWLSPADSSTNINRARELRHPGTGDWILGAAKFQEWFPGSHRRHLWLYGLVGCGKTVLSARIIDHLAGRTVLAFFFDFSDSKKRTTDAMLRSLVFQAYTHQLRIGKDPEGILQVSEDQPSNGTLWESLCKMLINLGEVVILLDALDESTTRSKLIDWIKDAVGMRELERVRLIFTSRPESEFHQHIPSIIGEDNCLPLDETAINRDICSYVQAKLINDISFSKKVPAGGDLSRNIGRVVGEDAGPMFLLASCHVEELSKCTNPRAIRDCLQRLPKDLTQMYDRVMENIPPQLKQDAMRLLLFIVNSGRPLRVGEAGDVIATQAETEPRDFDPERRPFNAHALLEYCPSLLRLETDQVQGEALQLAHISLKDYLVGRPDFKDPGASISITWTCLTYLRTIQSDGSDIDAEFPFRTAAWEFWKQHGSRAEVSDEIVEESVGLLQARATTPVLKEVTSLHEPWSLLPLITACAGGFPRTIKRLVEMQSDPSSLTIVLIAASARGHGDIVRALLDMKELLEPGALMLAPWFASVWGREDVVRLLLQAEELCDPQALSGILCIASISRRCEGVVRLLLLKAKELLCPIDVSRAIFIASAEGNEEVLRLLRAVEGPLHQGAILTALCFASAQGQEDAVRLLLETQQHFQTEALTEAIGIAWANRHQGVARLLLEARNRAEELAFFRDMERPQACEAKIKTGKVEEEKPDDVTRTLLEFIPEELLGIETWGLERQAAVQKGTRRTHFDDDGFLTFKP
ncbi:hypothetical protein RB598_009454 [Gaeumannomyces tritici]